MKYRPILFTTDMVRAILDGRKTQTRRIKYKCDVGDILWVRETWREEGLNDESAYIYKADFTADWTKQKKLHWKPNIFMPREACRLFLQVENVWTEKLQDIRNNDYNYIREGIAINKEKALAVARLQLNHDFVKLWDSINAKRGYGWDTNPLVKVIEFRRHDG